MTKPFTSLIDYEKVILENSSPKRKYSFNLKLQEVTPTWHLNDNRKSIKTEQERTELAEGTGFKIIGDPVLDKYRCTKHFLCECNTCTFKIITTRSALLSKQLNCINCLNNRLAKEAKSFNLELVGESLDGRTARRHYRFIGCNHTRDIATADVRAGAFSCTECYSDKFNLCIEQAGFENLGKVPSKGVAQYYNVKYISCGHTRIALQGHLMTNTVGACQICYEKELASDVLEKYSVTLLEKLTQTNRLIRFNDCSHTKVVNLSNLKSGSFKCNICQISKFNKEAEAVGLTYIKSSSTEENPSKHHIYLADCGHSLLIKPNHVRTGHWTCRTCNSGYLDRPNKIYLFEISCGDFTFLKLGYSQKPEYRKHDYKLVKGSTDALIKTVTVKTGREAIILENALHAKYKQFNYKSSHMKKYLTESGFSECYPVSLKEVFISELNEIEKMVDEIPLYSNRELK